MAQWLRDTIAASPGLAIDTLIERADHAGWGFKVTGPLAKIVRRNIADLDARGEINLTEERAAPTVNMRPTTAQCE